MMRFNKPCIKCGTLSPETYCPTHMAERQKRIQQARDKQPGRKERKSQLYNRTYRKQAQVIRATGGTCHICKQGERINDPWQVDHIDAGNPNSPLALAHRSCNASRGNKPLNNT